MTESPMFKPPGASIGPFFVRLGNISAMRDSLLSAALTYADTQDATTAAISAGPRVVSDVRSRIRMMTDNEVVVYDLLKEITAGAQYRVWADQDKLVDEMVDLADASDGRNTCLRLLRSMKQRGLLEESGGAWKAVC